MPPRLELPFKATKIDKNGTYVIVTDLFLSSKQLVGSTLSSLTKPLKSILKKNDLVGKMIVFNTLKLDFRKIKLSKNSNCICAINAND